LSNTAQTLVEAAVQPDGGANMKLASSNELFQLQNCLLYEKDGGAEDDHLGSKIDAQQLLVKQQLLVRRRAAPLPHPAQQQADMHSTLQRPPQCALQRLILR